jgi:hypothetical protein|tara:strand:+ start:3649 stop:4983 length:1335 start_codon:yes stop_codon:yes gene_type:complete
MNIQEILQEEYQKSLGDKSFDLLQEMINTELDKVYDEMHSESSPLQEMTADRAEKFLLVLPKFTPTEAWGNPDSMERKQINRLFSVIGGGRDISAKLAFLQRIAVADTKITSPRRIISSLMILESLSAVISSFSASAAGFVFEGFLSALLQGEQEAEISKKGNLPIQDLIAFVGTESSVPVSLKLLRMSGGVHGSFTNLVDALDEFGRMVYIVARKAGDEIVIEQFEFTRENFIDVLTLNARGKSKKAGALLFKLPEMTAEQSIDKLQSISDWDELYELLLHTEGYSEKVRAKRAVVSAEAEVEGGIDQELETALQEAIRQEWEMPLLEGGGSSDGGRQWAISAKQLPTFGFADYKNLGALPYSPKSIENIARMHMHSLNDELSVLFTATKRLSENINKYFTFDKRSRALASAQRGIDDSIAIQASLKAEINQPKKPGEEDGGF